MADSLFVRGKKQDASLDMIPQSCPLFAACPYLYDALKTTKGEKGNVVKGCTVRVGFHLTELQVCVTDEVNHLYAYAVLDPFKTLPEALEEVLSSGCLNWQESRGKR